MKINKRGIILAVVLVAVLLFGWIMLKPTDAEASAREAKVICSEGEKLEEYIERLEIQVETQKYIERRAYNG